MVGEQDGGGTLDVSTWYTDKSGWMGLVKWKAKKIDLNAV
jgi:hypothetical protein